MWRELNPFKCSVTAHLRPVSLTIDTHINMQWKRPASVTVPFQKALCALAFDTSPLVPVGLRDPPAAQEEGCSGPWPKLDLHNLTKNNRERETVRESERETGSVLTNTSSVCEQKKSSTPLV